MGRRLSLLAMPAAALALCCAPVPALASGTGGAAVPSSVSNDDGSAVPSTGGAAANDPRATEAERERAERRAARRRREAEEKRRREAEERRRREARKRAATYVFPIAGWHSFGGAGSRFGASRPGHIHQGQDVSAPEGATLRA